MTPDEDADDVFYRPPPPPDDRIWRHPSERAAAALAPDRSRGHALSLASSTGGLLGLLVLAALTGSLLTWGVIAVTGGLGDRVVEIVERQAVPVPAGVDFVSAGSSESVVAVAAAVRPAIARIDVQSMGQSGSGSGVMFRDTGYLLTNRHVVANADTLTVVLSDGREFDGTLVGSDEDTDIAVIKIEGGPFTIATLGSAVDLEVGASAIAIGSPLGLRGGPSVTVGVISALGRRVDGTGGVPLLDMIQTDAPIAPGSSGGALLDGRGAVVGITTAIAVSDVGAEGLGFATPIDIARAAADDLIVHGRVQRVWLGIEGIDLASGDAAALDIIGGAQIQRVVDDSPARAAGLEVDDVIIALDDREIRSMSQLVVALRSFNPGDVTELTIVRDDKRVSVTVTLVERAESD